MKKRGLIDTSVREAFRIYFFGDGDIFHLARMITGIGEDCVNNGREIRVLLSSILTVEREYANGTFE